MRDHQNVTTFEVSTFTKFQISTINTNFVDLYEKQIAAYVITLYTLTSWLMEC